MLPEVVRHINASRVVFGTDFPHLDHGADIVDELLVRRSEVGEDALRAILWDNARQLMGMPSVSTDAPR